jgi:hypothetical protein
LKKKTNFGTLTLLTYLSDTQDYSEYPDHSIDPEKKDYEWILRYVRAAWSNGRSYTYNSFFGSTRKSEIRDYALGKQSISKYKKQILGDEQVDKSGLNIDWSPLALLPKYREIAISKILQQEYETEAFCVDPLAKSEEDEHFNQLKIKVMMRQAAEQAGADVSQIPSLQPQPNEPQDMEQLQMQMKYGYKHQKAMESEIGISLIKHQNDYDEKRKRVVESLYDYGRGGYKEYIDENGMVKFREISDENLLTSYYLKPDASDMLHCGELQFVSVTDLAPYFSTEQLNYLCENVAGKYGNPNRLPIVNNYGRAWDKFKVAVLDFEFFSWNTTVYKKEIDGKANLRTYKSDYQNLGRTDTIEFFKGQAEPKYIDATRKVVFKCKWIVESDMMYDYGLAKNMKRKQSSWWDTSLSFHLYSWNFHNMKMTGITERLIPIADRICLTWYKVQNMRNKLIPYIIQIDQNALEGISYGKGGNKNDPAEIMDFVLQHFAFIYRSTDLLSKNPNYKPLSIEATGQLTALQSLEESFRADVALLQQVSGLNDFTDANTPPSKTLVPGIEAAVQATNNALYLIQRADRWLCNKLSDAIVQRIQIAVGLGKVEGYAKALGSDTVRFYQINPDISNYELGIFTRESLTYEERQAFYQDLNLKDSQGLIDPAMKLIIMSCTNLKQAAELLAYHVGQQKELLHQQQMELVQQQAMSNAEAAQAIEAAKQNTIVMQGEVDMQRLAFEMQWTYLIEQMKKGADITSAEVQAQSRNIGDMIQAQAKIKATEITAKSRPKKTA